MHQKTSKIGPRFYVLCGMCLVAAGGIYALTVQGEQDARTAASPPDAAVAPTAGTPAPWYYDQPNNQHWDPGHNHWHPGPPPAIGQASVPSAPTAPSPEVPAPPGIDNPAPWQYDAATNRHYDPEHGHWHTGPAPQ